MVYRTADSSESSQYSEICSYETEPKFLAREICETVCMNEKIADFLVAAVYMRKFLATRRRFLEIPFKSGCMALKISTPESRLLTPRPLTLKKY